MCASVVPHSVHLRNLHAILWNSYIRFCLRSNFEYRSYTPNYIIHNQLFHVSHSYQICCNFYCLSTTNKLSNIFSKMHFKNIFQYHFCLTLWNINIQFVDFCNALSCVVTSRTPWLHLITLKCRFILLKNVRVDFFRRVSWKILNYTFAFDMWHFVDQFDVVTMKLSNLL